MRKMYLKKENKKSMKKAQGFMMIEAVFSIFIVGTILVTFLVVMGSVYRTEFAKRDLIIATNLAQEGIEIVRNVRDKNWKTCEDASSPCSDYREAFDGGLPMAQPYFPQNLSIGTHYCVGYGNPNINPDCSSIKLKLDANGFYGYGGVTDTKFYRDIVISGNGDLRTITSTVTWDSKNITMQDTLYAWGDSE